MSWMASSRLDSLLAPISQVLASSFGLPHLPAYFSTVLFSAIGFQVVESLSGPISSQLFPRTYSSLKRSARKSWNLHVVSLVHSLIIIPLALRAKLNQSPDLEAGKAFAWDPALGDVFGISTGYFAWDSVQSCIAFTDFGFVAHAFVCLTVYANAYRPFLAYYGATFLLWELSTPFLNFHWFLDKFGMTGGKLQLVNGIILITTFFGVRIIYGGYKTMDCLYTMQSIRDQIPFALYVFYCIGSLVLNFLNWLWFSKMIRALLKRFPKQVNRGTK